MAAEDTIYALSSGPGPAGIAVVRLSGPVAGAVVARLVGGLPAPRRAERACIADPATGEALDDGLVLWFPGPASYTGEDIGEFHLHGGRAVVDGVLGAIAREPGTRPAEPGEFTRRAFDNGKLDLTAAEGIADLVAAETAAQRRQALRQSGGALASVYEDWRERLLRALAHMEAEIDFPDEDLPESLAARTRPKLAELAAAMEAHLDDDRRGERLRDGVSLAIVGAPNVGKSSLLNALARRDAAIVSSTAGTTRDVIEVHLDLAGYPLVVMDMAGLREVVGTTALDEIEREGIARALARAESADLKLAVFDAAGPVDAATAALVDAATLVVANKIDIAGDVGPLAPPADRALLVSARTGDGLEALLEALRQLVTRRFAPAEAPAITRERHRRAVAGSAGSLRRALAAGAPELAAEDLRLAARELGRITGRVDVEEVLDVIFRDFCIGK